MPRSVSHTDGRTLPTPPGIPSPDATTRPGETRPGETRPAGAVTLPADPDAGVPFPAPDWEHEPAGEECWPDDPDVSPPPGLDPEFAALPADLLAERFGTSPLLAQLPPSERVGIFAPPNPYGAGFSVGGAADDLTPGTVLAGLAGREWDRGLAAVSDDALVGLMRAWRRLASWATAGEAAAVAELDRRRHAQVDAGADPRLAEHVADEIAPPLTLTTRGADLLLDFAGRLAGLPRTMAALRAGSIDRAKATVITSELTGLDPRHAAAVEAAVIGQAARQTTGQLRASVRRAVLAADPAAARKRREEAQKDARVEVWEEPAGTAALAGRDLAAADVLAADRHLTALARHLKRSGVEGTLSQLRARAYLSLLLGSPVDSLITAPAPAGPSGTRQAQHHTPPTQGQHHTPPTQGQHHTPPSQGQHHTPPTQGQHHTPCGQGQHHTPYGQGQHNTSPAPGQRHGPPGQRNSPRAQNQRQTPLGQGQHHGPPATGQRHGPPGQHQRHNSPAQSQRQGCAPPGQPDTDTPVTEPHHRAASLAPPGTHSATAASPGTPAAPAPTTAVSVTEIPATQTPATQTPATPAPATQTPATPAPATQTPATQTPATPAAATKALAPAAPVGTGSAGSALTGSINLTMPLATWLGGGTGAGEVPGYGPIPAADAQRLAGRLAAAPGTRWCITLTSPDGRAIAHGCARCKPGAGPGGESGGAADWELTVTIKPLAAGTCHHSRESRGYVPGPGLRHLISVRDATCTAPGCRRPAESSDLDHTTAYQQGGRSCECNLGPARFTENRM